MLVDGQIWKNGNKIAQVNIKDKKFRAVIFKIKKEKLSFIGMIDLNNEIALFNMGFKPIKSVLVAKER